MTDTYKNYVDGEWHASETGATFEVTNPANTSEIVAEVQDSSSEGANEAIEVMEENLE